MGVLGDLAAPSLFSSIRCVVRARSRGPARGRPTPALLDYAAAPSEDIGLMLVHSGGQKGSGLLTRLRKVAGGHRGEVGLAASPRSSPASCPPRSAAHGGRIAEDAADLLVQAVGQDLRALAGGRQPAGQRLPRRAADRVDRAASTSAAGPR